MRRLYFFLLLLFISNAVNAREIYNLNDNWTFSTSYSLSNNTTNVTLPHVWDITNSSNQNNTSGHYLKEINIPNSFKGKQVYLRFGGAGSVATLFINGKYVYEHKGAYSAFNVNITPYINYGRYNSILVSVSNAPRVDVMPYASDNKIFGGLYASVDMIVTSPNHFSLSHYSSEGVYIDTKSIDGNKASLEATVMITGEPSKAIEVAINIDNNNSSNVTSASRNVRLDSRGEGKVIIPFKINNVELWGGKNAPNLYGLTATLNVNGTKTDVISTSFGVRKFSINSDNQFVLNGEPLPLNGVNIIQDNLKSASSYNSSDLQRDISLVSELGANAVRVRGGAYSSEAFDLYDRNGIVAWVDMPLTSDTRYKGKGYVDGYITKENGREQMLEIIYQNFNHPSICFWGIFSEITSTGDNPTEYIQQLNSLAKSISPNRITVGSSIEDGYINTITDAISWPIYYGFNKSDINDFELWTKQIKNEHGSLNPAISEYGTTAYEVNPSELSLINRDEEDPTLSQFHERYIKIIKNYPIFWGTFVNSMFDYTITDIEPATGLNICNMGLVDYSRTEKRDAFYLYKANWNHDESFVHITNKNEKRSGSNQTIKAYTNEQSAKLIVNGQFISDIEVVNGIAEWNNIELKKGLNRIVVSTTKSNDSCEVELYDSLLAQ